MSSPSNADLTRWLVGLTKPVLRPLGLASVFSVLHELAQLAVMGSAAALVVSGAEQVGWLLPSSVPSVGVLVALIVGLTVFGALANYLEQYSGHFVAFKALALLRMALLEALIPQAPFRSRRRRSGDLVQQATADVDAIEVFFAHTFPPAVAVAVVAPTAVVVLGVSAGWMPALWVAAVMAVLALVVPRIGVAALHRGGDQAAAARGAISAQVNETLAGAETIRVFGAERRRVGKLSAADGRLVAASEPSARIAGLRQALVALTPLAASLGFVLIGTRAGASASALMIGTAITLALVRPVADVPEFVAALQPTWAAARRVYATMHEAPAVVEASSPRPVPDIIAPVVLDRVSVTYPESDRAALDLGSALEVPSGEVLAVVGTSGSGKSTLAALLVRAFDPSAGQLLAAGHDITEFGLSDWRSRVALVEQTPVVLTGSIRDNLRVVAPDADDETLWRALGAAGLAQGDAQLPGGLDTRLGARGARVSGGQLQRVAIARALLREPALLVLDEATSALDTTTAGRVWDTLGRLSAQGTGVVVTTHRMAEALRADRLVVLEQGRVVEGGVPGELAEGSGPFAAMLRQERLTLGDSWGRP